jgi:hypothetical protein
MSVLFFGSLLQNLNHSFFSKSFGTMNRVDKSYKGREMGNPTEAKSKLKFT